jgi:transcriptional regulator with XRE-family HTH domain
MTDARPRGQEGGARPLSSAVIAAIREAVEQQGLTLAAVAEEAGVGDLLSRMEESPSGDLELGVSHVASISRALGVSASELLARAETRIREEQ